MTLKNKVRFHWLTHLFRAISKLITDIFYDNNGTKKFSLGRTSFIVWFYITCYGVVDAIRTDNVIVMAGLPLWWALVGLSLLGYVIGTKYIVTKLYASSMNITDIKIDDDERPGPH